MVICEYCGTRLELGRDEQKVLGKGEQQRWQMPIAIGDSFKHRGTRYEVIARMVLIEDNDPTDPTREYLLFHPRRGSMWLAEYQGSYDLASATHVMPQDEPFAKARGETLSTHDGRKWVAVENGLAKIAYVDGALPWIAEVGDEVRFAECEAADGSGDLYEVEVSAGGTSFAEREYGLGRRIPVSAVRRALGKTDLPEPAAPVESVAATSSKFRWMIAAAVVALLVNGLLLLVAMAKGSTVLEQRFDSSELDGEVLSKPFEVAKPGTVLKVVLASSRLDNAWMAVDLAVVEGEDTVVHVTDSDIAYYHGVEGGESWSEGSRKTAQYIKVADSGTYRLLVHAVSARGNESTATRCEHPLGVRVIAGAVRPHFFIASTVLAGLCLLLVASRYNKWKQQDDED